MNISSHVANLWQKDDQVRAGDFHVLSPPQCYVKSIPMTHNSPYGQPIGPPVTIADALLPTDGPFIGKSVTLERLDPACHGDDLYASIGHPSHASIWTYLPYGPHPTRKAFDQEIKNLAAHNVEKPYVILLRSPAPNTPRAVGTFRFINIKQSNRCIEIGFVVLSPLLQRTRAATEAFYLAAKHVFDDLGYRKYVWKCDALNAPSRRAAERLGFTYEGLFRQDLITKGRNRDTTWYGMTDGEWEGVKKGYESWLDDSNFDGDGKQRRKLEEVRGDYVV